MTDLERLADDHSPATSPFGRAGEQFCRGCDVPWPCTTAVLIDAINRLTLRFEDHVDGHYDD